MKRCPRAAPLKSKEEDKKSENQGCSLFIGNLSRYCKESELLDTFSEYKVLEASIKVMKGSRMPLGYGFLQFPTYDAALKCKTDCNGKNLNGRNIKLSWAQRNTRLIISNLDLSVNRERLCDMFKKFGDINENLIRIYHGDSSSSAVVEFDLRFSAEKAKKEINAKKTEPPYIRAEWYTGSTVFDESTTENDIVSVYIRYESKVPDKLIDEVFIARAFSAFGKVVDVSIKKSFTSQAGTHIGYGFVHFENSEDGKASALCAIDAMQWMCVEDVLYCAEASKHLLRVLNEGQQDLELQSIPQGSEELFKFNQTSALEPGDHDKLSQSRFSTAPAALYPSTYSEEEDLTHYEHNQTQASDLLKPCGLGHCYATSPSVYHHHYHQPTLSSIESFGDNARDHSMELSKNLHDQTQMQHEMMNDTGNCFSDSNSYSSLYHNEFDEDTRAKNYELANNYTYMNRDDSHLSAFVDEHVQSMPDKMPEMGSRYPSSPAAFPHLTSNSHHSLQEKMAEDAFGERNYSSSPAALCRAASSIADLKNSSQSSKSITPTFHTTKHHDSTTYKGNKKAFIEQSSFDDCNGPYSGSSERFRTDAQMTSAQRFPPVHKTQRKQQCNALAYYSADTVAFPPSPLLRSSIQPYGSAGASFPPQASSTDPNRPRSYASSSSTSPRSQAAHGYPIHEDSVHPNWNSQRSPFEIYASPVEKNRQPFVARYGSVFGGGISNGVTGGSSGYSVGKPYSLEEPPSSFPEMQAYQSSNTIREGEGRGRVRGQWSGYMKQLQPPPQQQLSPPPGLCQPSVEYGKYAQQMMPMQPHLMTTASHMAQTQARFSSDRARGYRSNPTATPTPMQPSYSVQLPDSMQQRFMQVQPGYGHLQHTQPPIRNPVEVSNNSENGRVMDTSHYQRHQQVYHQQPDGYIDEYESL